MTSPVWPSNLPWLMDLTCQVPMKFCSLQYWTLLPSPATSTTGCCFCLALSLHSFSSYFSLISSSILGTYQPGEFIFQCLIFLPFHTVHGVLKVRILKWFAIHFSNGPPFVRTLHHDPSVLGGPTWHGSQFHWVRQDSGTCDQIGSFLWLWFPFCLPFDGEGSEAYGSFLMGETDWRGNWVLFWWGGGACSVVFNQFFC